MALPIKCILCFGLMCLILGSLLLAIFCSHLIPSVVYTAKFRRVTCTVASSNYYAEDSCCDLSTPTEENPCENTYPCLRVIVAVIDNGETVTDNATLYDEYTTIFYQPKKGSCSLYTCAATYDVSKKKTDAFRTKYGDVGGSLDCYYKPGDTTTALQWCRSNDLFIEMTILSLALLLAGTVITLYAYRKQARINSGEDMIVRLVDDVKTALSCDAATPVKVPPTDVNFEAPITSDRPEAHDEKSSKTLKPRSARRHDKSEPGTSGSGHSEHRRKPRRSHVDLEALPEGGSDSLQRLATIPADEHGSEDGRKHKRKGKKSKKAPRDHEHEPELLTPETTTSEIV